ncbi:hypothetical protein EDD86DRAFT_247579 [Gorgonomyces haynaldii]|nr:hypothetical protein EDD86DRAFT_247579 [Gorgonomyces haynaldii]
MSVPSESSILLSERTHSDFLSATSSSRASSFYAHLEAARQMKVAESLARIEKPAEEEKSVHQITFLSRLGISEMKSEAQETEDDPTQFKLIVAQDYLKKARSECKPTSFDDLRGSEGDLLFQSQSKYKDQATATDDDLSDIKHMEDSLPFNTGLSYIKTNAKLDTAFSELYQTVNARLKLLEQDYQLGIDQTRRECDRLLEKAKMRAFVQRTLKEREIEINKIKEEKSLGLKEAKEKERKLKEEQEVCKAHIAKLLQILSKAGQLTTEEMEEAAATRKAHVALIKEYRTKVRDLDGEEERLQSQVETQEEELKQLQRLITEEANREDDKEQEEEEQVITDHGAIDRFRAQYRAKVDKLQFQQEMELKAMVEKREKMTRTWTKRIQVSKKMQNVTHIFKILRRQERILEYAAKYLKKPKETKDSSITTFFEGVKFSKLNARRKDDPTIIRPPPLSDGIFFLSLVRDWHTPRVHDNSNRPLTPDDSESYASMQSFGSDARMAQMDRLMQSNASIMTTLTTKTGYGDNRTTEGSQDLIARLQNMRVKSRQSRLRTEQDVESSEGSEMSIARTDDSRRVSRDRYNRDISTGNVSRMDMDSDDSYDYPQLQSGSHSSSLTHSQLYRSSLTQSQTQRESIGDVEGRRRSARPRMPVDSRLGMIESVDISSTQFHSNRLSEAGPSQPIIKEISASTTRITRPAPILTNPSRLGAFKLDQEDEPLSRQSSFHSYSSEPRLSEMSATKNPKAPKTQATPKRITPKSPLPKERPPMLLDRIGSKMSRTTGSDPVLSRESSSVFHSRRSSISRVADGRRSSVSRVAESRRSSISRAPDRRRSQGYPESQQGVNQPQSTQDSRLSVGRDSVARYSVAKDSLGSMAGRRMSLTITTPTFNEKQNLPDMALVGRSSILSPNEKLVEYQMERRKSHDSRLSGFSQDSRPSSFSMSVDSRPHSFNVSESSGPHSFTISEDDRAASFNAQELHQGLSIVQVTDSRSRGSVNKTNDSRLSLPASRGGNRSSQSLRVVDSRPTIRTDGSSFKLMYSQSIAKSDGNSFRSQESNSFVKATDSNASFHSSSSFSIGKTNRRLSVPAIDVSRTPSYDQRQSLMSSATPKFTSLQVLWTRTRTKQSSNT